MLTSSVERAREDLEHRRVDEDLLEELYRRYNSSVGNVRLYVRRAHGLFPNLNCGLASVYLRYLLGRGEVVQGRYGQHDHTFLLIDGTTIVDVTADQYRGPKVYVGPIKEPWSIK